MAESRVEAREGPPARDADAVYARFLKVWRQVFPARPRPSDPSLIWAGWSHEIAGLTDSPYALGAYDAEEQACFPLIADVTAPPADRFATLVRLLGIDRDGKNRGPAYLLRTTGERLLTEALAARWWIDIADAWLRVFHHYPPVADHPMSNWYILGDLSEVSALNERPPDHLDPGLWAGFWQATDAWLWDRMTSGGEGSYAGHLPHVGSVFRSGEWRWQLADSATAAARLLDGAAPLTREQTARLTRITLINGLVAPSELPR